MNSRFAFIVVVTCLSFVVGWAKAEASVFPEFEAYLFFVQNLPNDKEVDWAERLQGISHDESNWYITQEKALHRVPLDVSLNGNIKNNPRVRTKNLQDVPALNGYRHFGDISVHRGFVLVPVDKHDNGQETAVLAIFRADETLEFVGKAFFSGQGRSAGWVAVDGKGFVHSSTSDTSALRVYEVADWDDIGPNFNLNFVRQIPLFTNDGRELTLEDMQGGVVTPSGRLIYLTNGICKGLGGVTSKNPGIHVVDLESGLRIAKSCQEGCLFQYKFDLCTLGEANDEPEGITIWDLDESAVPGNVEGQLHVILLNNDAFRSNVHIRHYSRKIYVDVNRPNGNGRIRTPFNNLRDAFDFAWDGATLVLENGRYSAPPRMAKHVRMEGRTGVVRIGR